MTVGSRASFVISWLQTEVDGIRAPSPALVKVGAYWRWTGEAVRVDAPGMPLLLEGAEGAEEMRRRAARKVQRLIGPVAAAASALAEDLVSGIPLANSFSVTDGRDLYDLTLLPSGAQGAGLLLFSGMVPPEGRDLWISQSRLERPAGDAQAEAAGVICFASGTRILTARGARPVESLMPGDLVQTLDDGLCPVLWTGSRMMTGARLYAMPHLRPVRLRGGAFGNDRPEEDLLVSPAHRILLRGPAAEALFNTDEVLVAAKDLVNDHSVTIDHRLHDLCYHHVMLDRHAVIFANGLEAESFHPAATALDLLEPGDRAGLEALLPGVARDPMVYGAHARRCLSAPEAAILHHGPMAWPGAALRA